jgi:hypothetical protein
MPISGLLHCRRRNGLSSSAKPPQTCLLSAFGRLAIAFGAEDNFPKIHSGNCLFRESATPRQTIQLAVPNYSKAQLLTTFNFDISLF